MIAGRRFNPRPANRSGAIGSSHVSNPRRPAHNQSLPLPPAPGADLSYPSDWGEKNARRLELSEEFLAANEELFGLLHENYKRVELNRYNLAIFVSVAQLYRQNLDMLRSLATMDSQLKRAADAARKDQAREALQSVDRAIDQAYSMQWSRNRVLRDVQRTWYQTWYPRVAEANGRKVLHEVDDVKDHLADRAHGHDVPHPSRDVSACRRVGAATQSARNRYAEAHKMPLRKDQFDWKDLKSVSGSELGVITLE